MEIPRYHGLDFFRCFALLMGLVIHAPLVFVLPRVVGPQNLGYDSVVVEVIVSWIHLWRIPAFFLLSGFFAQMVIGKKGVKYFLLDRFVRIFVTLVVFLVTISLLSGRPVQLLYHLWFLYYLFIVCIGCSAVHCLMKRIGTGRTLSFVSKTNSTRIAIAIWAVVAVVLTSYGRTDGLLAITPQTFSSWSLGPILYYWIWFILGQMVFARREMLAAIVSQKVLLWLLGAAIAMSSLLVMLLDYAGEAGNWATDIFINIASTGVTFSWIFLLIGLCHRYMDRPSKTLNLMVELSYPVYLFHLIPALFFGKVLYDLRFSALEIMVPNVILTGVVSVALYYILVKFTPLNWIVNGYKKSWLRPF